MTPPPSRRADDHHLLPGCTRPLSRTACSAVPRRSALPPPARTTGRPAWPPAGLLQCGRVLGERAALAGPVHLVPGTEAGHAGAGRRRHPGHVTAADLNRGRAKRQPEDADKAGLAGHQVPHTRFPAGGAHPDEHLLLTDRRPAGVTHPEHVGRAAGVLNDRLQFATPPMVRATGNTPPSTRAVPDATRFEQDRNAGGRGRGGWPAVTAGGRASPAHYRSTVRRSAARMSPAR